MLTVDDIYNLKRKSHYDHVSFSASVKYPSSVPYQAEVYGGTLDTAGRKWKGPRRATAEAAAHDYCDYINSGQAPAPKPQTPRPLPRMLNQANHPQRPKRSTDAPPRSASRVSVREWSREQRLSNPEPGFVYLIGIEGHAEYVKIGWSSSSGFTRLADLQTGNPLLLVGLAELAGMRKDEYALHCRYESDNVLGEWFIASPELLAEFDLTWNRFATKVNDIYAIDLDAV